MAEEILEAFSPILDGEGERRFNHLIANLARAYPNYKSELIRRELDTLQCEPDDIDMLKYKAALSTLYDLTQQGWTVEINRETLFLRITDDTALDKSHVRYRLDSERRAQFQDESVLRFITHMEKSKPFNGVSISVENLIGDREFLVDAIRREDTEFIQPYIQLVTHTRDEHTGYYDSEIWRYFRYTWSIPYKSMPGRNLFYLVRDAAQPFHPVIGIFALGNSVLNLTVRDDEIGWTVEAIKQQMKRQEKNEVSENLVSGTNGVIKSKKTTFLETEAAYKERIRLYSEKTLKLLIKNLHDAIGDIYVRDLGYNRNTKYPSPEKIRELKELSEALREKAINNKKTGNVSNWEDEAREPLFYKKRAAELARLLEAQSVFNSAKKNNYVDWLNELLRTEAGRKAINTSLVANRKTKIGSNMMEIIVCGAIPPYNELLGGKLVSMLACSPTVIHDYTKKYERQVSEIASRMKGKRVIRDSRLAFLGTTSLYAIGSSQYNRIKVPMAKDFTLQFKKMGTTEGYGSIYFSKRTASTMMQILEHQDGGRRINNIFG
ncbi:DUF4338 domain-containing protein, partial [Ruminococcaceae bacterium OttesenSCG-928-L11]|nr:DUF4338 domain-containing protein [Ruminococcaceae bacterium OttesenSCG-928-L11]